MLTKFKITNGWKDLFKKEFEKDYIKDLENFLFNEKQQSKEIYPQEVNIFNAYKLCSLDEIKVVVIGQDPYPSEGFANGLSFSVSNGIRTPASLKNIFKEIERDLGHPVPSTGNLEPWAKQGVLLLNTVLTVVKKTRNAHAGKGWEKFTTATIEAINQLDHPVVFLAWGASAHEICEQVDESKHCVIRTSHPSNMGGACRRSGVTKLGKPYSAFVKSSCFSTSNNLLTVNKLNPIDWSL
jgi:uracil-DNA glycosylase